MHQARVAVAPGAADAGAGRAVGLVQQDPARRVERLVAAVLQVVGQLLDPWLVGDRGPRILPRPVALGGVLAVRPVHLVEPLGLGVPGLELVVAQRPGRRDPVHVLNLAEVRGPQPVQRGAVHLGGPADVVVHLRLERFAVRVVPGVVGDVFPVHEHGLRVPVVHFAGQEIAAFQEQDLLSRGGQGVREGAPAGAGPDDDHVIAFGHHSTMAVRGAVTSPSRVSTPPRPAITPRG